MAAHLEPKGAVSGSLIAHLAGVTVSRPARRAQAPGAEVAALAAASARRLRGCDRGKLRWRAGERTSRRATAPGHAGAAAARLHPRPVRQPLDEAARANLSGARRSRRCASGRSRARTIGASRSRKNQRIFRQPRISGLRLRGPAFARPRQSAIWRRRATSPTARSAAAGPPGVGKTHLAAGARPRGDPGRLRRAVHDGDDAGRRPGQGARGESGWRSGCWRCRSRSC